MGPQDPRLSSRAEGERSAAKGKGTGWGQYVAVSSAFNSPLTNNPFVTLWQSFRIKCERYIFQKKCLRSSLLCWLFPHVYGCDYTTHIHELTLLSPRGCPRGVMFKAMDCGIVVREFVLQSRYYVHIRTNTLRKGMNPRILPAMG